MNKEEEIVETLKSKNYRITTSRKSIINFFINNKDKHFLIEELINELEKDENNINISSIYNNLEVLLNENIIAKYNFNNKNYYEYSENVHGHFSCKKCNKTFNINVPGLDCMNVIINKKYEAEVQSYSIEFYGICEECKKHKNKENNNG